MKIIFVAFLFFISGNTYSKYPYESFQHLMNRVVIQTDTIFVGKILEKKELSRGLIVDGGEKYIGILEVEIIKIYRGHIRKNEIRLVCTWFDKTEHEFNFEIGQEFIFFGIDTGLNIQLPSTYGYIRGINGIEKEISKALKLPRKPIKNLSLLFEIIDSGDIVTRNACNEANAW